MPYKNPEDRKRNSEKYYAKNRYEILAKKAVYRESLDKEIKKAYNKNYYKANQEEILAQKKEYHKRTQPERIAYQIEYRKKNPKKVKKDQEIYRNDPKNKKIKFEYDQQYSLKNRDKLNKKGLKWILDKKKVDPVFKFTTLLRSRVLTAFKNGGWKKGKSKELLGCSYEEAVNHIEKQFKEGMTWENHGTKGWHIDHIVGLCNAKTEDELIKLCHYTNLQPLWAKENLQKPKYINVKS